MKLEENDKLILITNDDGLYAGGIRTLIRIMEDFGKLVVISATESRSAMSQALTVKQPLRV
ncbi:5'/3'-nucleotidase SurE, partial [bacterium]|nr:5'/3'-nucleotidase SurE [bacterium]